MPILNVAGMVSTASILLAIYGFLITNRYLLFLNLPFRFERSFLMSAQLKVQNGLDILLSDYNKQFILSFISFALFIVYMSVGILAVGLIDS